MTHQLRLRGSVAALIAVLFVGLVLAQRPLGYPDDPGYGRQNPQPHLGSTGFRGPPLSMALPTSGRFSGGLRVGGAVAGEPTQVRRTAGASSSMLPPVSSYRSHMNNQMALPPPPMVSSQNMVGMAMIRGIYGGLRF